MKNCKGLWIGLQKYHIQKYQNYIQILSMLGMLYDDFSGEEGELTAITQYIYEHIEFKCESQISNILLKIAIEEMRHVEILGEIIKKLGGKPIYINSQKQYWTSENVKYNFSNLDEMLEYNVKAEEKAIEGYKKAIIYTNNMYLKNVFERIILDEQKHKEIFMKLKS